MNPEAVRERAAALPENPGVYQFYEGETVLYVGKAVDLRDRVRSYGTPRNSRIEQMVSRAERIEYAVTDTERQALLLESNLIKRHQPWYNVRLKDDKSYPLVQLTNHAVPRIEITRAPDESAAIYGPFSDYGRLEVVVKALRQMYGLRGCSDSKYSNRDRPCIDYDIGLCTAPCTGEISEEEYLDDVASVKRFFKGETGVLSKPMEAAMEAAAENEDFERAANLRDRLTVIREFHKGGEDVIHQERDAETMDCLGVAFEGEVAIVARLHSEDGQLVDRSQHEMDTPKDYRDVGEVLSAFVVQYYTEREFPESLLLSEPLADTEVNTWLEEESVSVTVPGTGRHRKLVELAMKNAQKRPIQRNVVTELSEALGIESAARIEGFDVSHSQGKAVVGSNVLFVDGESDSSGYRRKKLVDENDDYANMKRLVRWRAERGVEGRDARPDPGLLLIDGGEGQLNAAIEALEEVGWSIPAIGLEKKEEVIVQADGTRLDWGQKDERLQLLQRVRDEAHRFAVQYHQMLREEVTTTLDSIPGVGPSLRQKLLRRFGSVEKIRAASEEELLDIDGVGERTVERLKKSL